MNRGDAVIYRSLQGEPWAAEIGVVHEGGKHLDIMVRASKESDLHLTRIRFCDGPADRGCVVLPPAIDGHDEKT